MAGARGFTLMELMVALLIVTILSLIAAPAFNDMVERFRLRKAAENLLYDVMEARSLTTKKQRPVYLSVDQDNSCYGINLEQACACAVEGNCKVDEVERRVTSSDLSDLRLQTTFSDGDLIFSPRDSLPAEAGSFTLTDTQDRSVTVVVTALGATRLCSDTFSEYGACP